MKRRHFLSLPALALLRGRLEAAPFPVVFRKPGHYEALRQFIVPGQDEFTGEKAAMEVESILSSLAVKRELPLARGFEGASPVAKAYRKVDEQVSRAEFDSADKDFAKGLRRWLEQLGEIRRLQFYALPDNHVRFECASERDGSLFYRTGEWRMEWNEGKLARFRPVSETLIQTREKLFSDCTAHLFGGSESFAKQLARGSPYWRGRLDSASGIDIYGNNGIAAGDIDNDGWDEIYVCQPGGLPNRLYKRGADGRFVDITAKAGLDLLDETSCALFADFRNSGRQDLVVLTSGGPLYFVNRGDGAFHLAPQAFRFASEVQGSFTGMAAADYDRDGKLDLYLCTYVHFRSEDGYRYPVPYHDAQNGPPNYLFRNSLDAEGAGYFEDVTAACGINENNNRYSFAPAWCDYDGDGWPDLYVANDFGRNNLYKNSEGRFHDVAAQAGVEDLGPGMSASWFDYDGDGHPDLYVANMWSPAGKRVVADKKFQAFASDSYRRHTKGNSLYRNRGDGTFEERPAADGAEMGRWAWSSEGVDFDNDGTPEIAIAAGMLTNSNPQDLMSFFWRQVVARSPMEAKQSPEYENGWNAINQYIREEYSWNGHEPNVFYVRRGEQFRDFSGVSGFDFADDSRSFAVTDFDGDGNLDLILKSRLGPQIRALRNQCGVGRRSIEFALRGTKSNRDAIGASVEIEWRGRRSRKFVQAGSGYLAQHTKRLYFGLDQETAAAKVTVRWPSGGVQSFDNLEAGFRYDIQEGSSELKRVAFLKREPMPEGKLDVDNKPGFDATWLLEPVPVPERRSGPGFLLLTDGGEAPRGMETLDLKQAAPQTAACYALFRRYLFDLRMPLELPLSLLLDDAGRVNKIYPRIPSSETRKADLLALQSGDRQKLALPFAGWYHARPSRNQYKLGAAMLGAGYPDQALPYLEEAIRQWPGNFKAELAIGQAHLESGRFAEARVHLNRATALNPASGEAWNNLGGVAMGEKNYEDALICFEKALRIQPDSSSALANAAQVQAKLNRKDEAEKNFRRALELDPKDSDSADQLGLLMAQGGRMGEAIELFKRSLTNQPKHVSTINNLGVAYIQIGKPEDAVAAFQYGLKVAPDNEMLLLNLVRVRVSMGQRERAREDLAAFLARVPSSAIAKRALEQLGEP